MSCPLPPGDPLSSPLPRCHAMGISFDLVYTHCPIIRIYPKIPLCANPRHLLRYIVMTISPFYSVLFAPFSYPQTIPDEPRPPAKLFRFFISYGLTIIPLNFTTAFHQALCPVSSPPPPITRPSRVLFLGLVFGLLLANPDLPIRLSASIPLQHLPGLRTGLDTAFVFVARANREAPDVARLPNRLACHG